MFGGVEAGAEEEIGGSGVVVLAKQLEQAGRAETGAAHEGAGVGEGGGVGARLGDDGLDRFEHRVGAAREVVGVAFLARAQTVGAGGLDRGEEHGVFRLRLLGVAGGQAVDARRGNAEKEAAVATRVAGEHAFVHRGIGHSHDATLAQRTVAVVRIISPQF